jgi:hypothetical protein
MRNEPSLQVDQIGLVIRTIRGQRVILDADLARIYGVPTHRLNEQVKRNDKRFPPDFLFQLTAEEAKNLKSQIAISSSHGGRRTLPYAFTENGAIMAANVLNSPQAVRMSVFVVRAFVQMRELLGSTKDLAKQLAALEKKLTERLDGHENAIVDVLRRMMDILDPPAATRRRTTAASRNRISYEGRGRKAQSQEEVTAVLGIFSSCAANGVQEYLLHAL